MTVIDIFALQFVLSLLVFGLLAAWVARPLFQRLELPEVLFWLTVPHAFRHIGMVFEVPGVVSPDMPGSFSAAAAYGDLAAGMLAILTLIAIRRRSSVMIPLAWLLNIVGTADLALALTHIEAVPYFQSAWYIPTMLVPLLLVAHFMAFHQLLSRKREARNAVSNDNG
jgi:hypothetical protein